MAARGGAFRGDIISLSGPLLVVLAGPNGAGKTTFFRTQLAPTGLHFVNADLLARELRPDDPAALGYAAAQLADQVRHQLLALRETFCMETVFSDPAGDKLSFIQQAKTAGYTVVLIFIGIESAELSEARVFQRVSEGGHDVPRDKLIARYPRTMGNLLLAVGIVDRAYVFDNSSADRPYEFVARYDSSALIRRADRIPGWAAGLPGLS